MPLCAAPCRCSQSRRRKYALLITLLADWQSEGQGFDPPQLHQCFCGVGEFLSDPVFIRGRPGLSPKLAKLRSTSSSGAPRQLSLDQLADDLGEASGTRLAPSNPVPAPPLSTE
jgi:hypothetical protein